jgi:hypothetical protein
MRRFLYEQTHLSKATTIWAVAGLLSILALAALEYRFGRQDLLDGAGNTETLLAEKLAQHDAHLSALGAIVRMSPVDPSPSIQGLSENILSRYPGIIEIATFRLDAGSARIFRYGKPAGATEENGRPLAEIPKLSNVGDIVGRALPGEQAYDIFKLVEPGRVLRLRIDADALLNGENASQGYSTKLTLNDETLTVHGATEKALLAATTRIAMTSHTQPLQLEISRNFGLGELVPLRLAVPLIVGWAAVIWLPCFIGKPWLNAAVMRQGRRC